MAGPLLTRVYGDSVAKKKTCGILAAVRVTKRKAGCFAERRGLPSLPRGDDGQDGATMLVLNAREIIRMARMRRMGNAGESKVSSPRLR